MRKDTWAYMGLVLVVIVAFWAWVHIKKNGSDVRQNLSQGVGARLDAPEEVEVISEPQNLPGSEMVVVKVRRMHGINSGYTFAAFTNAQVHRGQVVLCRQGHPGTESGFEYGAPIVDKLPPK